MWPVQKSCKLQGAPPPPHTFREGSCILLVLFVGLAYQGKDIVFRFIIEYSSLKDFGP